MMSAHVLPRALYISSLFTLVLWMAVLTMDDVLQGVGSQSC